MSSYLDLSKPLNASLPRQQISLSDKLKDKDKYGINENRLWELITNSYCSMLAKNYIYRDVGEFEINDIDLGKFNITSSYHHFNSYYFPAFRRQKICQC